MLKTKLYYYLKPFIPRSLQLFARRRIVAYKRKKYAHIWPIDPNAGNPPPNWKGWPDGKQFALVLSHDVDTQKGFDAIPKLMDIEEKLGFRSSFNIVPERYRVSRELIGEIKHRGFEVCVHGLNHDGKLFFSKKIFTERSKKINQYIQDWGAAGFTSPSMHHNLEWMNLLDIRHATSTFDTDPFEPQPDAVGTIFPFFVNNSSSKNGYVELPYTLPQDHLLYVIMKQINIDIWKQKLDWIVAKGGMALLNTHSDYMAFETSKNAIETYPLKFYSEFLIYVKHKYEGRYLNALPRQVGSIWKEQMAQENNTIPRPHRMKACMLAYSFYEQDNRIRRYTETLLRQGADVDVISLRRPGQSVSGVVNDANVFRIQKRLRNEKSKISYLLKLIFFFVNSLFFITLRHLKSRYDVIHVHSVPDFEVFATFFAKLLGARIILDIHDIVPEFYASKFQTSKDSPLFKILLFIEKASCWFAHHVIIANDIWYETITNRSVSAEKCTSILNFPDNRLFYRKATQKKSHKKFVILYPGSLNWHQGLDLAIQAFGMIADKVPHVEFHIYGEGPLKPQLKNMVSIKGIKESVKIFDTVSIDKISRIMRSADLGVIPKRNDFFGGEAFSTKSLEFMLLGVPVIVSRTKIDSYYYKDNLVTFFEPENPEDLAQAMLKIITDKDLRKRQAQNAYTYAQQNSWDLKKYLYLGIVNQLLKKNLS